MPGLHQHTLKRCKTCTQDKIISAFGRKGSGGRAAHCKDCANATARRRHATVSTSQASKQDAYQFRSHLKCKYGITPEVYEALHLAQGGLCRICRQPESEKIAKGRATTRRLSVDHDHATGTLRGLLCRACNRALGGFKDDPELLLAAAVYLENARRVVDDTDLE